MADSLDGRREVGPAIGRGGGELADDAGKPRVERVRFQPCPPGRVVVKLVDLCRDFRTLKRAGRSESDGRLEARFPDALLAVFEKLPHGSFRNRRSRRRIGAPSSRNPIRLIHELPRVDDIAMTSRDAKEAI